MREPERARTRSAPPSCSEKARSAEPEPEKVPIGISLPDLTMDQFMDIEDGWSTREERV